MEIRQSDLSSFARCAQEKKINDQIRDGVITGKPVLLSATVYGSVLHHALQVMDTLHSQGREDAYDVALGTFLHYWSPDNAATLDSVEGWVTEWIARQTYSGLRDQGRESLSLYRDWLIKDTGKLIALEHTFRVPISVEVDGEWEQHTLKGTVDRLTIRRYGGKPFLDLEDHKTGKVKRYLRYNVQFTAYAYAATQRSFWDPWEDKADEFFTRFGNAPKRGTWISHKEGKRIDAGWRGGQDYDRLALAIAQYIKAVRYNVYPLNMDGEICVYCPHARGACGGVPTPEEDHGRP